MVFSQLTYLSNTAYVGVSYMAGSGMHRPQHTFLQNALVDSPMLNMRFPPVKEEFLIFFASQLPLYCLGCVFQILLGHVQSDHLQLPLLVCPHHHLHHRNNQNQHILHGLLGGLFLFPALWGWFAAETHQEHPTLLGLADCIQRVCDYHEKYTVSKWLPLHNTLVVSV